jgi:hypothetical protein
MLGKGPTYMITLHTYYHRYIPIYIHIFNFDQSSEDIGIGYEACHKINLIEGNQQSLNKPDAHGHKYAQKHRT